MKKIADKSDKSYKLLPAIDLINAAYQAAVSNVDEQAIGKHMTKFKGHHSCKQNVKNKPMKCGFKRWCYCFSKRRYVTATGLEPTTT